MHPCTALPPSGEGGTPPAAGSATAHTCQLPALPTAKHPGAVLLHLIRKKKRNSIGYQFVNLHAVSISREQVCRSTWGKETSARRMSWEKWEVTLPKLCYTLFFCLCLHCFVSHTWALWPLNPWETEHPKESSNRKNRCQKHEWPQRKIEDRDSPLPWKERNTF